MKAAERERLDWTIVVIIILVLGFILVMIAGQRAVRFASYWQLHANMDSHIDPNSTFVASRPDGFIEPVDASILTPPGWGDFLTPGVTVVTGTPFPPITSTSSPAPTTVLAATSTVTMASTPTNTFVFIPWTQTSTRKPKPTKSDPTSTDLPTTPTLVTAPTLSPTSTVTPTVTFTTPTITQTPITIPTDTTPPEIGTTPDGDVYFLPSGGSLTLGINLVANGDGNYDLVYYERPAPGGTGIFLDWVIVEISDGTNWYTVFYWGDNIADTNSNMDFNLLPNPETPEEDDQRDIPTGSLYNGTGVAIDIDGIVPAGAYSYIRFTAPTGDSDNQTEIDAIEVLP